MNKEIITKIVKATGISQGELVLVHFWGEDSEKEFANKFMTAIVSIGATPVLLQQSRTINKEIFENAKASCFNDKYFDLFKSFDTVLDLFTYQPIVLGCKLAQEQTDIYKSYISELFYKLVNIKRFIQIRLPTEANADESGLDPQDFINRLNNAYDIDYELLEKRCREEILKFVGLKSISVHTGDDCVLHMCLDGRQWHIDAGDGDLPCGEIYVAPIETESNGNIYFKELYLNDKKYDDVSIKVEEGKVCGSNDAEVNAFFSKLSNEDRVVCELGIGMNPNIKKLCGYTVLDEKMMGTFHIAIGANDMFGGTNKSSHHIDFVGYGKLEVNK